MKIQLFCFSFFFLLAGCSSSCNWFYQEVDNAGPCYSCAQISHAASRPFKGLALEFQWGIYGSLGYLSVLANQIPSSPDYPRYTPITLFIEEEKVTFWGYINLGGQRVQMPEEATNLMIDSLCAHKKVGVAIYDLYSEFYPENFPSLYTHLRKK